MSIFEKILGAPSKALNKVKAMASKKEKFVFEALPENLEDMKRYPESNLDSPYKTAALTVLALCAYAADKDAGTAMLNYLRSPSRQMTPYDHSFLKDRLMDGKTYIPFSYFEGATPENSYDFEKVKPYTLVVKSNQYSDDNKGYKKLFLQSGGADSLRAVILHEEGGKWYLWQQELMSEIRKPQSPDLWA